MEILVFFLVITLVIGQAILDPVLPISVGNISPFAGNYVFETTADTGDGGPATAATLSQPLAVAVDTIRGLVYVAGGDRDNIR